MDAVGILARSSEDVSAVFEALRGVDEHDATTAELSPVPLSYDRPLCVGLVRELMESDAVEKEAKETVRRAAEVFAANGAVIRDVSLPSPHRALASYCVLSAVEAFSNLARYDGVRFGRRSERAASLEELYSNTRAEGFGNEVKRRILFGACMLQGERREVYLPRAEYARYEVRSAMHSMLEKYDLILGPTTPGAAFPLGAGLKPEQRREADLCAVYANLAGLPAISIPYGRTGEGLPLGVHLTAGRGKEELLFFAAELMEEAGI